MGSIPEGPHNRPEDAHTSRACILWAAVACSVGHLKTPGSIMKSSDRRVAVGGPEAAVARVDHTPAASDSPPQRAPSAGVTTPGRAPASLRCDGMVTTAAAAAAAAPLPPASVVTAADGRACCGLANMRIRKLSRASTPSLLGRLPGVVGTASDWSDDNQDLRKKPRPRRSISCPTRSRKAAKFASETDTTTSSR